MFIAVLKWVNFSQNQEPRTKNQEPRTHPMIYTFKGITPVYDDTNFIAPSADVIGDVELGAHTSVWFNATIRGDIHSIRIGRESNIQDNAVVHITRKTGPVSIGNRVTVGHSAVVHACTIEDNVLIGMGAIILDNAFIGANSIVGAGALVTARTIVPPGSMVLGSPAKVVRPLKPEEIASIGKYADNYINNGKDFSSAEFRTANVE